MHRQAIFAMIIAVLHGCSITGGGGGGGGGGSPEPGPAPGYAVAAVNVPDVVPSGIKTYATVTVKNQGGQPVPATVNFTWDGFTIPGAAWASIEPGKTVRGSVHLPDNNAVETKPSPSTWHTVTVQLDGGPIETFRVEYPPAILPTAKG
jgi:hypothetical protein